MLTINLGILLLLAIVAEGFYRILKPDNKPYIRTFPDHLSSPNFKRMDNFWSRPDSFLGWTLEKDTMLVVPNPTSMGDTSYNVINKQGFRNPFDLDSIPKVAGKRIMFIGDSFIYSLYLNEEETIIHHLGNMSSDSNAYINLGTPGYGFDQSFLSYIKYKELIKPDLVVFFYIDDDISRAMETYRASEGNFKMSYKLENGKLKPRTEGKPKAMMLVEKSMLINKAYHKLIEYESKKLCEVILDSLITNLNQSRIPLAVFRCPSPMYNEIVESEFYSFKNYFQSKDVMYVELLDDVKQSYPETYMNLYIKDDGHPSAEGAKFFAERILFHLKSKGCL